ncbi:5058_t:CDS:10 [Funneliformis geosporum]|uniref:3574_t:CDS:1 n=1 Tax=Funneliformis geosporum TaxID=1117311 RepID=A0A9W4SAG6_9GLOM|nr:5058_t:CDS:10 [Funneliformis geosporum]CAI2162712.1 3574_t:CDS:10 [Funneliformis geosporum]
MDYYGENNEIDEEVEEENLEEGDEEEEEGDAWDDSALIAAWDLAVKEFQATSRIEVLEDFHSIKANTSKSSAENENISDTTPRSVNITEENTFESFVQPDTFDESEDATTSESVKKDIINEQKRNVQKSPEPNSKPSKPQPDNGANPTVNDPNISFPPPKAPVPIPGFDDEALSNLIMAWYYSGYYTGLYQGRKGR